MDNLMAAPQRGIVKCYFPLKEFGFITRSHGKDLFFMRSDFADEEQIVEGAVVEFLIQTTEKGPRASSVRRVA